MKRRESKTVLMIDYYFPPLAGSGVHRTLGYVRHLSEFGWNPIVLTAEPGEHNFYDPSLLEWIPQGLPVTRTPSIEPVRFAKRVLMRTSGKQTLRRGTQDDAAGKSIARLASFQSWILFPDRRIGWMPFAVWAAARLRRRLPIDVIHSTSTAITSHLIAYALKMLWRKPWVADFQDPWTEEYASTFPSPLHRRMALALEHLIIRHADRVTMTTGPMKEIFQRKYPGVEREKFQVIPMGFDPQALAGIRGAPQQKFTITHYGNFYGTRSPEPFLRALGACVAREPALRDRAEVLFLGTFEPRIRNLADSLIREQALQNIVRLLPPVAHRHGMQQLMSSHILLLVTDPGGCGQYLVPSKLFDYFAVGRPVLALTPEGGAAAELIREARAGLVVRPDDVTAIQDAILTLYREWHEGTLSDGANHEFTALCTWRARTARVAGVLEATLNAPATIGDLAQTEGAP